MVVRMNPFLRPLMLRRNGNRWQVAPEGGNTDWRPLAGAEDMTAPEAIVLATERYRQMTRHMPDAPAESGLEV